jgi:RNA polymerase sigma factor (sigma-70 family)
MSSSSRGTILRDVDTLFRRGRTGSLTDAQLLERFATRNREDAEWAFAMLVERHGPMVLRACRALLRNDHDAEDAFQAVFLVLAKRARFLWVRDSLGPWLHEVACRAASCARTATARRRWHEHRAAKAAEPRTMKCEADDDSAAIVHEEANRLPQKYRLPIVLCYLEGLTHEQAAEQLGWPVGTVRSRLARGRERLRGRLLRRGVAPALAAFGASLQAEAASSAVPTSLVETTVRAAAQFASGRGLEGVSAVAAIVTGNLLRTILMTKVKLAAISLVGASAIATGAAVLAQKVPEARPPSAQPAADKPAAPDIETQNEYIRNKLEQRLDFDFGHATTLSGFLKYIKAATEGVADNGVPIYVNPDSLKEVGKTMESPAEITMKNAPIRTALRDVLRRSKLSHEIRDGLLVIDSRDAILESRLDSMERKLDRVLEALESSKRH